MALTPALSQWERESPLDNANPAEYSYAPNTSDSIHICPLAAMPAPMEV